MKEFRKEPTLRTARIVYLLTEGAQLTTMEIANTLDISYEAARTMMEIISSSHHVPITTIAGKWQVVKEDSKVTLTKT